MLEDEALTCFRPARLKKDLRQKAALGSIAGIKEWLTIRYRQWRIFQSRTRKTVWHLRCDGLMLGRVSVNNCCCRNRTRLAGSKIAEPACRCLWYMEVSSITSMSFSVEYRLAA